MKVLMGQSAVNYTKLLLHCDGNLTDSSATAKTVTAPSGISYVTGKFGQAINLNNKYLSVAHHSDFILGTQEWAVECCITTPSLSTTNWPNFITRSDNKFLVYIDAATGKLRAYAANTSGGTLFALTSSVAYPLSQWVHVAVERDNANQLVRLYQGGAVVASVSISPSAELYPNNVPWWLGCASNSGTPTSFLQGYMDEPRFIIGNAPYRGAFTPPTAPYSA